MLPSFLRPQTICAGALLALFAAAGSPLAAQVPPLLNYQGRVAVDAVNFEGTGSFAFALVSADGSTTYWSHDGSSVAGSQPASFLPLTVSKGLYSVLLGDVSVSGMSAIPLSVWSQPDVRLRVWFNDGTHGPQLLTPDQRLAPNGYLPDGAVTGAKIAPAAVQSGNLAPGAVGNAQLAPAAVAAWNILPGSVGSGELAQGAVGSTQLAIGAVGPTQLATGAAAAPIVVTSSPTQLLANRRYAIDSAAPTVLFLPFAANAGDRIEVQGTGSGAWQVRSQFQAVPNLGAGFWFGLAVSPNGQYLAASASTGSGGYFISQNGGQTWARTQTNPGGLVWDNMAISADGQKHLALLRVLNGSSADFYVSTDGGASFAPRTHSTGNVSAVCVTADGTRMVAGGSGGISYSSDGGATWTLSNAPGAGYTSIASSADGSRMVASSTLTAAILHSTDFGATWTVGNITGAAVAMSADGQRLIVNRNQRVWGSTDGGATWAQLGLQENSTFAKMRISDDGRTMAAALGFGGVIWMSYDAGATWQTEPGTSIGADVHRGLALVADGSKVFVGPNTGPILQGYGVGGFGFSGQQGSTSIYQSYGQNRWALVTSPVGPGVIGNTQLAANLTLPGTTNGTFNGGFSGSFSGNGAALTGLNAASVTSGTLPLAQLPASVVLTGATQTLANKTLTAPVIASIVNSGTLTLPSTTDTLVGRNTTDTLTNKTLTTPTIASLLNGGTVTIPAGTDTLVTLNATQTLANKTISGTLSGSFNGTVSGNGAGLTNLNAANLTGTLAAVNGGNVTNLNASNLASGTVADARLSGNIPRLNQGNTFNGPLSIGTYLNRGMLEVHGNVIYNPGSFAVFGTGGTGAGSGNIACTIYADNTTLSANFVAVSDARIKEVRGRSDGAADLLTLQGLEITDYTHRDTLARGTGVVKKVIAQQVETVFPQAVTKHRDCIPDIYRLAPVADGWVTLTTDLKVGERVKLIVGQEPSVQEVLEIAPGRFRTALQTASPELFVYGREVDDFRAVDYEALSMLNVSATQELARRLAAREAELAALQQTVAHLVARERERESAQRVRLAPRPRNAPKVAQTAAR